MARPPGLEAFEVQMCHVEDCTPGDMPVSSKLRFADATRVCSCYLGGKFAPARGRLKGGRKSTHPFRPWSFVMPARRDAAATTESREERIEAILKELRPKIEATVRHMVERAVDVPEAEEFGAIDFEFRDAGQELANEVRQAGVASRKKRGT
jgi:hypothetical protein